MAVNFGVNYLAVVVAAVVAVIIGFIWYAPQVFGNRWMAYLGTTRAQLGQPAPSGLAAGVAGALINSWVLAVLSLNLGGKRPWALWLLNNAHNLIVQIVMGAIVTAWR